MMTLNILDKLMRTHHQRTHRLISTLVLVFVRWNLLLLFAGYINQELDWHGSMFCFSFKLNFI
jgi:hypothetical protein